MDCTNCTTLTARAEQAEAALADEKAKRLEDIEDQRQEYLRAEAAVAALAEIRGYVTHKDDCALETGAGYAQSRDVIPCTCGLSTLLKGDGTL